MSIAHPPSVFVSSTCYDLAQVRQDLNLFFKSMGMLPILSETSSFPVNPGIGAIENCLAGVKEKADIFVLVVGARYGSETENGKSVTNLEYLEAKVKGIPRYVFIQKPILTTLPIWQKNRSADFSGFVDSSKLFEFVESLRSPKEKNWVFPFESAQDITETLRAQLAYLFMDALTIWAKVQGSGLSDALLQDLSGSALLFAVHKPFAWEHRLFSQVLCDEMSQVASIKKDLKYGLALGNAVRLGSPCEVKEWAMMKCGEIQLFMKSAESLVNTALPKALGPRGELGDIGEIVYVAKRLAKVYLRILEWTIEFRHIQVENKFRRLLELISQMSHNAIKEIEAFAIDSSQQINGVVRRYEESKQPQSIEIKCTLTCPDVTELNDEILRLKKQWEPD
jgi:hypothetical protein